MSVTFLPFSSTTHTKHAWWIGSRKSTHCKHRSRPLRTRAIPERFCGGVSLRRGAISSVWTFTFYLYTPSVTWGCALGHAGYTPSLTQGLRIGPCRLHSLCHMGLRIGPCRLHSLCHMSHGVAHWAMLER